MNVYDKAYELTKAIKESNEYADCKAAALAIQADEEGKRMLDDFRSQQLELQQRLMNGESPSSDEMDRMQKRFEILNMNPNIQRIFEAERRLGVIVEDVNRIIMEPLKDVL
ncbi:hypothetical protein SY83_21645 [Paenibacillus swuensis]|uniref:UPF0342 protein SY83_21645 n=1 Tax=Paenibacillus swuensis TaxID=1178515 RepID=A0A172TPY6_9BACL|nr:YlbF family regulator [Paenibacillus swuensis]ANE49108.1 hypothetical protein SY83_21645 [Paenibacillus swuensis]